MLSTRNIPLWLIRAFFSNLLFFFSIWYLFETHFTTPAVLGLIYGVSQLLTILLEVPSGYFADKWGRKASTILGFLLQALSWLIVGSTLSVAYLWVGYILNGIGLAFVSGAASALDYDSLKHDNRTKEYSKWMSRANILGSIAIAVSIVAGSYIYEWNPRWTYYSVAIGLIIATIAVLFAKEPPNEDSLEVVSIKSFFTTLREIMQNQKSRILLTYYAIMAGLSYSYIFVFALIYAIGAFPDAVVRGYVLAAIVTVVGFIAGFVAKRLVNTPKIALFAWGVILAVGYLGAAIFGYWFAIGWMVLLYLSHDTRLVLIDQFIHDEFPSTFRATLFSVLNLGASLMAFIGLSVGTWGIEQFGIQSVFYVLSGFTILTIIGYFVATLSSARS